MKTYYPRFRYQFREAFSYLSAVMLTEGKGEQKDEKLRFRDRTRYYFVFRTARLES